MDVNVFPPTSACNPAITSCGVVAETSRSREMFEWMRLSSVCSFLSYCTKSTEPNEADRIFVYTTMIIGWGAVIFQILFGFSSGEKASTSQKMKRTFAPFFLLYRKKCTVCHPRFRGDSSDQIFSNAPANNVGWPLPLNAVFWPLWTKSFDKKEICAQNTFAILIPRRKFDITAEENHQK